MLFCSEPFHKGRSWARTYYDIGIPDPTDVNFEDVNERVSELVYQSLSNRQRTDTVNYEQMKTRGPVHHDIDGM